MCFYLDLHGWLLHLRQLHPQTVTCPRREDANAWWGGQEGVRVCGGSVCGGGVCVWGLPSGNQLLSSGSTVVPHIHKWRSWRRVASDHSEAGTARAIPTTGEQGSG